MSGLRLMETLCPALRIHRRWRGHLDFRNETMRLYEDCVVKNPAAAEWDRAENELFKLFDTVQDAH